MRKITLSEYNSIPEAWRGIWTTERWDLPDWAGMRERHMGKRTLMVNDNGTCLLVEGLGFEIVDDSSWKKPEEIKKEIRERYLEFRAEKGHEPHFLDCAIRWNDTLETQEARIALNMEPDTEKDGVVCFNTFSSTCSHLPQCVQLPAHNPAVPDSAQSGGNAELSSQYSRDIWENPGSMKSNTLPE